MVRFAEIQPDEAIVATLSQQLGWSHVLALLPIKDPLARDFYAEMCRIERWDVRTLRKKIGGMLFERTALSKNTKAVIAAEVGQLRDGRVTPEAVFRDPYFLDFLGLKGAYSERDLEAAILREMETFLLEMGTQPRPFSFLFSDPTSRRLNSSSPITGGANCGNGSANAAASVAIKSGVWVRIAASISAYP